MVHNPKLRNKVVKLENIPLEEKKKVAAMSQTFVSLKQVTIEDY